MWRFDSHPRFDLPDTRRFLDRLNQQAGLFDRGLPLTVGRGPGRLDLMGGIADYSGALVLQLPLAAATYTAVQADSAAILRVCSTSAEEIEAEALAEYALGDLLPATGPLPYAEARALFARDPKRHWAAYAAGVLIVLHHELGVRPPAGLRLFIHSEVPAGKGVSSSAAIEVATMAAIAGHLGLAIAPRDLALWCQKVENLIVGAPCGVMDQMTSAAGEQGDLLALLCQPAELQAPVRLPEALQVWGIDSGIRHAVSGADYGSVRTGAFMGYRIVADLAGLSATPAGPGRVAIQDPLWGGYLANLRTDVWEAQYRDRVPEHMSGREFLSRYQGFTDAVTAIDPDAFYAIRTPTAHPIYEMARVQHFRELLLRPLTEASAIDLGQLMIASHQSYTACGLGSAGTDRLVELVADKAAAGLFGAKITGGGSGGTVAILGRPDARAAVDQVVAEYAAETGQMPVVFEGTSPGAMQFGTFELSKA
jgi:L-arabinokinase